MKKATILGAVVAMSILGASAAMADKWQERDYRWHRSQQQQHQKYEKKMQKKYEKQERKAEKRARARWARGEAWPAQYRDNRYIVSDWNKRKLRRPPSGYNWYRADDRYVLVRKDNNIIEDIIDALN